MPFFYFGASNNFMRYAYVGHERVEPQKGLRGLCACCGGELIAKCGHFKIHHWAHKDLKSCDPWWENESEWHRQWKSHFPPERQEVVFVSPATQEKHIADVYSEKGVILEFQSYAIDVEEVRARENFYQQLVWVINGVKNEFDKFYFAQSIVGTDPNDSMLKNVKWFGRSKLFAKWAQATKQVYFDFGTDIVWHLVRFDSNSKTGQVRAYEKEKFIQFYGGTSKPILSFQQSAFGDR
ncbi:MAG: competence protein CoiA family protein [Sideroxydans sp.]|nr:competence protein CoiA family protein [Sideroxydans sp.]